MRIMMEEVSLHRWITIYKCWLNFMISSDGFVQTVITFETIEY